MTPVTDPAILAQLNGGQTGLKPVTDPVVLAQLNGQPQAAPEPSMMQRAMTSVPGRFLHGIVDPLVGFAQMSANWGGTNPVADIATDPRTGEIYSAPMQESAANAVNSGIARSESRYQADRKATGQDGIDLARIAGNIASPINFAFPGPAQGAGLAARIGNGALVGGALSALQPVSNGGDFAREKAAQVGLGALGGAALPVVGAGLKTGGKLVRGIVGETTGAGSKSLQHAYDAGKAGGDQAQAFTDSMRGEVPWGQVVDDAKVALGKLREQRGEAYRNGMVDVKNDATVLSFGDVDRAIENTAGVKAFRGRSGTGPAQDLAPKAADARQEVIDAVDQWKALDPADFHTPEGFDALKQKLGVIKDSYQYGTAQWKIASEAYNAVRNSVAKQAPAYNKVMQGYNEASDEITALEKELSLGKKVNPNTALRKLQSVMRDNANTSWGERSNMAQRLSDAGAPNLLPSLAGQALSTPIPRGLAKYADAAALLHYPSLGAVAALPFASPRAMGELAYGAGKAARGATALGNLPVIRALPKLPVGSVGVGLPQLLANPAIYGAQ